ncbi:MAG: TerC family protein, partial [Oligoflexus sp.]
MNLQNVSLFPFEQYWWLYLAFVGLVLIMLLLDLGVFHKEAHSVSVKEAATWSVVWVSLALIFNLGLYYYASWQFTNDPRLMAIPGFEPAVASKQVGLEFLTGYLVEKALAVDNIFVFIIVFSYFAIPPKYQHRVLFYGILGALIFRAIFIALGSVLMQYEWVVLLFGVFLIFTGAKMLFSKDEAPDPGSNPIVKLARRFLPITDKLHGQAFFVREKGVLMATPLFLALLFLEFSDIIFAVDSVPAIFAITKEPFIVFTSNIFAILGLRSMYFLLADIMHRFHYLKYGLAFILMFVGLKMTYLNEAFGGKFPITWSLGIIGSILVGSVVVSLIFKPQAADKGS